jgi:hypothetical protein
MGWYPQAPHTASQACHKRFFLGGTRHALFQKGPCLFIFVNIFLVGFDIKIKIKQMELRNEIK